MAESTLTRSYSNGQEQPCGLGPRAWCFQTSYGDLEHTQKLEVGKTIVGFARACEA